MSVGQKLTAMHTPYNNDTPKHPQHKHELRSDMNVVIPNSTEQVFGTIE